MLPRVAICLMGPTASGKTQIAIELVRHLQCDIISVDSAMVYRGMDIGTAKPTPEQLKITPHRLIDIRDPLNPYSAGQFVSDASSVMEEIFERQRIPLLVGGTMMYFRALQKGITDLPPADAIIRARLVDEVKTLGTVQMHNQLAKVDPLAASKIDPHDSQRIQRAMEVYLITGKPLSSHWADDIENQLKNKPLINSSCQMINMAIAPLDRMVLHARIQQRFEKMLQQGFVEEVETLMKRGDLQEDLPALRAVGYRQVWNYLNHQLTFEEMGQQAIIATRQLAKRQLTWLRSWLEIQWFDSESPNLLQQILLYLEEKGVRG